MSNESGGSGVTATAPVPAANTNESGSSGPSPRRLFIIAIFAAVLGLIVTLSFGYADHDPQPHNVRVGVSASQPVISQLSAGLAKESPGAFTLVPAASAGAAERSVRDQTNFGAFIVPPSGDTTIVTAGAQGTLGQTVITKAFTAVSTKLHRGVTSVDVAALPANDHAGLGTFVFELGLLIPSVIGSVGLFLVGNRMRLWWRVLAGTLFALLAACGGTLAMDTIFGSLSGNGAALIGIGFLGAWSFVLTVAAIQSFVGLPGTGLAALAFIFVGNAVSGGSVPIPFLPDVFRQVAPWLPNNAIVRGVRDVIYYNGTDLFHPLLVLGLWPAAALLLLIFVDVLHLRARAKMPELLQEIYSTPGIVHLRTQLGSGHHESKLRPGAHAPVRVGAAAPAAEAGPGYPAVPADVPVSLDDVPSDVPVPLVGVGTPPSVALDDVPDEVPVDVDSALEEIPEELRSNGVAAATDGVWVAQKPVDLGDVPADVPVDLPEDELPGLPPATGHGSPSAADVPGPAMPDQRGTQNGSSNGHAGGIDLHLPDPHAPLPVNTGFPRVPDLDAPVDGGTEASGAEEKVVNADRVVVNAREVIIQAGEVWIKTDGPVRGDA